jgi:hypothetical protein
MRVLAQRDRLAPGAEARTASWFRRLRMTGSAPLVRSFGATTKVDLHDGQFPLLTARLNLCRRPEPNRSAQANAGLPGRTRPLPPIARKAGPKRCDSKSGTGFDHLSFSPEHSLQSEMPAFRRPGEGQLPLLSGPPLRTEPPVPTAEQHQLGPEFRKVVIPSQRPSPPQAP